MDKSLKAVLRKAFAIRFVKVPVAHRPLFFGFFFFFWGRWSWSRLSQAMGLREG